MNTPRTPEQLKTVQDLQKQQHERDLADLRWVVSKPAGRRVIWWILENLCMIFVNEFTGSSKDIQTNGKRSVGTAIHARLIEATGGFKVLDHMYREANRDREAESTIKQSILAKDEEE